MVSGCLKGTISGLLNGFSLVMKGTTLGWPSFTISGGLMLSGLSSPKGIINGFTFMISGLPSFFTTGGANSVSPSGKGMLSGLLVQEAIKIIMEKSKSDFFTKLN